MPDLLIIILLFAVGALVLLSEIFIPSHGVLGVIGVGFLIGAIAKTFEYAGSSAGITAIFVCLVILPVFSFLAIKYWRQTAVGRLIAPPNPQLTVEDTSVPVQEITQLIGRNGKAVSPLRPVGICEFDGRRVSCVAQFGMIEAGTEVEGVDMSGTNLAVAEKKA